MSPTDAPLNGHDRRDFARLMAALAAAAALPAAAIADDPKPDLPAVMEQLVRLRFGQFLTEEQVKQLARRATAQLGNSAALKRPPLTNADEPAVTFSADPS